jgi:hypothetical protein
VTTILLSGGLSLVIALLGTWPAIIVLRKRKLGQQIRGDGPQAHLSKSGTPVMGGIVIIIASWTGYVLGHMQTHDPVTASGVLVLFPGRHGADGALRAHSRPPRRRDAPASAAGQAGSGERSPPGAVSHAPRGDQRLAGTGKPEAGTRLVHPGPGCPSSRIAVQATP